MIPFVVLCLMLPISIFDYKETGVPFSDIVCLVGLLFFFKRYWSLEAIALYMAVFFAYISVVIGVIRYENYDFYAIVSVMYLFKPCFAYFVAREVIKSVEDRDQFFIMSAKVASFFIYWLFVVLILFYGGVVRDDSSLNGSFLGMQLFGSYGVNSLAAYYVLLVFVLAYTLSRCGLLVIEKFYMYGALVIAVYLIIGSLSRMAILGGGALLIALYYSFLKKHVVAGILIGAVFMSISIPLAMLAYDAGMGGAKINQIANGLSSGDMDYLSSGRLTLYGVALKQIFLNPFSGASFGGFEVYTSSISGYESISGLSPHNQYLTLFWKMGIPGALCYILFLSTICIGALKYSDDLDRPWINRLLIIVLLVFCNLWDVLLVSNIAALFYFLLGAFTGADRQNEK